MEVLHRPLWFLPRSWSHLRSSGCSGQRFPADWAEGLADHHTETHTVSCVLPANLFNHCRNTVRSGVTGQVVYRAGVSPLSGPKRKQEVVAFLVVPLPVGCRLFGLRPFIKNTVKKTELGLKDPEDIHDVMKVRVSLLRRQQSVRDFLVLLSPPEGLSARGSCRFCAAAPWFLGLHTTSCSWCDSCSSGHI